MEAVGVLVGDAVGVGDVVSAGVEPADCVLDGEGVLEGVTVDVGVGATYRHVSVYSPELPAVNGATITKYVRFVTDATVSAG